VGEQGRVSVRSPATAPHDAFEELSREWMREIVRDLATTTLTQIEDVADRCEVASGRVSTADILSLPLLPRRSFADECSQRRAQATNPT
jgi:hypothetical protein